MIEESVTNYFRALTALNDFFLSKLGFISKDHTERFFLLRQHNPSLYSITNKMFNLYRRSYNQTLNKDELWELRKNVEMSFKILKISIPNDNEIEKRIKELLKR
ncbi:MAG: hypothetical protein QXE64_01790 [Candidatus Pacearchaeota archaeon]